MIEPSKPNTPSKTGANKLVKPSILSKLLTVQQKLENITKKAYSDFGKYHYFQLSDLLEEVKQTLNDEGLIIIQEPNGQYLDTRIVDTETEYSEVRSSIDLTLLMASEKGKSQAQVYGSAVTYARKYALLAMLGLATEDDDGAAVGDSTGSNKNKFRNEKLTYTIDYPLKDGKTEKRTYEYKKVTKKDGEVTSLFERLDSDTKETFWEGSAGYDGLTMQIKFQKEKQDKLDKVKEAIINDDISLLAD